MWLMNDTFINQETEAQDKGTVSLVFDVMAAEERVLCEVRGGKAGTDGGGNK